MPVLLARPLCSGPCGFWPLAVLVALLCAFPARAQSTATPVTPGYMSTTGCPTGWTGACFIPYGPGGATSPVTPTAGTTGTLTTAGTSYTIVTGPVNGCYVYNGLTAAEQGGIAAAETANVDPVTTPVVALVTTTTLQPGQIWSCPSKMAAGVLVKANAATNGHKLNVVTW